MNTYPEISTRIKFIRTLLNYTQKQFAQKLFAAEYDREGSAPGLHIYISRVENGKQLPSAAMLIALAGYEVVISRNARNYSADDAAAVLGVSLPDGVEKRRVKISVDRIICGRDDAWVETLCNYLIDTPSSRREAFFAACTEIADDFVPDEIVEDDDASLARDSFLCALRLREVRNFVEKTCKLKLEKSRVSRQENRGGTPSASYLIDFCLKAGACADYVLNGSFGALPQELQYILSFYNYSTQLLLLNKFCTAAQKILG